MRPPTLPTIPTGFTDSDRVMVRIAHLSNSRTTLNWNSSHFAAWQLQLCPSRFTRHQDCRRTRGAAKSGSTTWRHLNATNFSPRWNVPHRKAVPQHRCRIWAVHQRCSCLQPVRCQNVGFGTVRVMQQSNPSRTIRIVLNRIHFGRNTILHSLEVDDAIHLLVSTTTMSCCDETLVVSPTMSLQSLEQTLLWLSTRRQLSKIADRRISSSG